VLVYVGAIVVLIMFVVQLTNTSLGQVNALPKSHTLVQNTVLVLTMVLLLSTAYGIMSQELLLNVSNLNLAQSLVDAGRISSLTGLTCYIDSSTHGSNLSSLASSIFNEYGYVLVISVHAIILAVIGPVKLALADLG
jgi:NADH:ubiquinone oxidoreductase subunit 6 (subunit J)